MKGTDTDYFDILEYHYSENIRSIRVVGKHFVTVGLDGTKGTKRRTHVDYKPPRCRMPRHEATICTHLWLAVSFMSRRWVARGDILRQIGRSSPELKGEKAQGHVGLLSSHLNHNYCRNEESVFLS